MRQIPLFFALATAFLSSGGLAQTVIYTTPAWPVADPQPGVLVQILENVHQLEQSLFPQLSDNPAQAEQQARARMQQHDWREREARLTRAYQALLDARTVGIEKVPAVVFDDKYVVYGTTDAALARQKLDAWRESQP
ncbi:TIGR03757 family integrating conjugative element protein [Salmonella enterica]|uniref:TIGR03757 family integrating conjugative element protein n=1 Tax=Salmonella enterica TaxID=28901 RepID=UPI0009AD4C7F|nr:TIGR03757 family integrating conjugative element protein [Salmonella enterica]